jgi:hypothetical protein
MKHTPEPWRVSGKIVNTQNVVSIKAIDKTISTLAADEFRNCTIEEVNANAARIVACVNACAGMDDPAAEIERLRDMEKNIAPIMQTVRSLAQHISRDKSIDQMTRLEALGLLMAIPAEKGINP